MSDSIILELRPDTVDQDAVAKPDEPYSGIDPLVEDLIEVLEDTGNR